MAAQMRHIGRVLRELYWVPSAYQIKTTYLFFLASQSIKINQY
jgi:hypothetical protein